MTTLVDEQSRHRPWQDTAETIGRQVGLPVVAGIVVFTAVSTAAGFLVTGALDSSIGSFDREVAQALVEARTTTINRVTGAATILADSATVAVLWIAAMALGAWRTRGWRLPMFFLAGIGGEKLTYLFTSLIVGRPRPSVESLGQVYATNSFPSGHVGSAIALYGGLVIAGLWFAGQSRQRHTPLGVRFALGASVVAITALVAYSRMSRGHHFLSDIAWGALLGIVWLVLAWRTTLGRRDDASTTR